MIVIKRDGRRVAYDESKIINAILAAAKACGEKDLDVESILDYIRVDLGSLEEVSIDRIQAAVEWSLMSANYYELARTYIAYRRERDIAREGSSQLLKDIEQFIDQSSEEYVRENANKAAGVVSTHRDLLAGILSKHLALTQILPKDVAEAHTRGVIHQHDNDYCLSPLTNCLLVNYQDMLKNGFKIGDARIETPKSIGTACTILTQITQAVASSTYGGQSHAHIDFGLEPYVEASWEKIDKEVGYYFDPQASGEEFYEFVWKKLEKEVYDAMQTLLYQINTLTTSNGQTPFITISLGLNTSKFGRLITEQYLKVHMKGIGKDEATPVFPKVIFFLEEGVNMNPEDPNYDLKQLAVKCSARRIYPDYISVKKNREITGAIGLPVTPMGCRSFLSQWKDDKFDGRFNLGVVSVNLAYVALEARRTEEPFYDVLERYCELCYKAHLARVERLKGTKAGQNPIMWVEGACARLDPDQTIDHLFYGGYASISLGYVGLYECVYYLVGNEDKELAEAILKIMRGYCHRWKEESGLSFSLYGTPSESLCYKAAKAIKQEFGEDVLTRDFVTNSFHYPVWEKCHPMTKWDYERGFAEISTGGNISYVETPNLSNNLVAYEGLLNYAYDQGLHYFAINTPVDKCYACGYEGEFHAHMGGYKCPSCGNEDPTTINVLRRVSGYISAPNSRPFNRGKQQEVIQRVKHMKEPR